MTLKNSFGFETVNEEERARRIRDVFSKVAPRYDFMNDAMSFGIHRLWKNTLARQIQQATDMVIVDLAGGTGDVAIRMNQADNTVVVADPGLEMILAGKKRHNLSAVATTAEQLAIADNTCDYVTMSFGIRNAANMDQALAEIYRILKPGGQCLILEFSTPAKWLKPFYDFHSFHIIPRLGAAIAREPAAYQYLVESIRQFPDQQAFADLMKDAGFRSVHFKNLSFGIACIHSGTK